MLNVLSFAASATLLKLKASGQLMLFDFGFYRASFRSFKLKVEKLLSENLMGKTDWQLHWNQTLH